MSLIDTILKSVKRLPPFPVVIQRALKLIEDPRSSAQDVVDVIQFDQSITADVLKLCNSAYFGLRGTIHSLREALVMIGFDKLLEIVLSREAMHFYQRPCRGYDLEDGQLWRHSVACALLSQIIDQRLNRERTATHFTAALLHDIGKLILSDFVKDYFQEIRRQLVEEKLSFVEAEKEVLGIDHAELGGRITEQWGFPPAIISGVRYHHAPFARSEAPDVVHLIYLCDVVSLLTGIGGGADGLSYPAYGRLMNHYHLTEKDVERFVLELDERFQGVEKLFNPERASLPSPAQA